MWDGVGFKLPGARFWPWRCFSPLSSGVLFRCFIEWRSPSTEAIDFTETNTPQTSRTNPDAGAYALVAAPVSVTIAVACAADGVAAVPADVNGVSAAFPCCCHWVFAQSSCLFSTVLSHLWLNLYGTIVIAAAWL